MYQASQLGPAIIGKHLSHEKPLEAPVPDATADATLQSNTRSSDPESLAVSDKNLLGHIRRLDTLMPDELRLNGLFADFSQVGGEPHLRDLALRVRVFREALEAWEALHLHSAQGSVQYQTDIARQLRASDMPRAQLREAIRTYDKYRAYINDFATHLFPYTAERSPDFTMFHAGFHRAGRGLVFTAGDAQVPYLLTSIPSFRKLGCDLPVEVMYLGDADLSPESRARLEAFDNVFTRDMSHMIDDSGWELAGWAAKPFALLMSEFREAMFIDADALFFVNAETLFADEQYLETGTLFFTDRNAMPESKRTWLTEVLPPPMSHRIQENRLWTGESGHMQDSGVVVVDKWKHFVPLLLTTRLNGPDRDGNKEEGRRGTYDMVYGKC